MLYGRESTKEGPLARGTDVVAEGVIRPPGSRDVCRFGRARADLALLGEPYTTLLWVGRESAIGTRCPGVQWWSGTGGGRGLPSRWATYGRGSKRERQPCVRATWGLVEGVWTSVLAGSPQGGLATRDCGICEDGRTAVARPRLQGRRWTVFWAL